MVMISKQRFSWDRMARFSCRGIVFFMAGTMGLALAANSARAQEAPALTGPWDISRDGGKLRCRIGLNPERSDLGDFFAVVPVACKHSMPFLAKIGRWSMTGNAHLALSAPDGESVLELSKDGEGFSGQGTDGASYRLAPIKPGKRAGAGIDPGAETAQASKPAVIELAARPAKVLPPVVSVRPGELAGRYAILRDKSHDTGCMLTLDNETKVKGGDRAALAPACRDQGIVIFDPVAWEIVKGRLVLIAKAGHSTHLDLQADGTWLKDPNEGKSLTLKKL